MIAVEQMALCEDDIDHRFCYVGIWPTDYLCSTLRNHDATLLPALLANSDIGMYLRRQEDLGNITNASRTWIQKKQKYTNYT